LWIRIHGPYHYTVSLNSSFYLIFGLKYYRQRSQFNSQQTMNFNINNTKLNTALFVLVTFCVETAFYDGLLKER